MKNKKKILSGLALSSVLLLGACGNGDSASGNEEVKDVEVAKEGFPIVEEEIELDFIAPGTGIFEWDENPTLEAYSEKTNINFNYSTPPLDDFTTRFNLTIASGDYPDVIFGPQEDALTPALEVSYGQQDILLPLNDLIEEYAPNLNALLEEKPEIKDAITTPDGNIYALPRIDESDTALWPTGPLWYNGEWMDALDAEVPETLDEFYNLLVRFRDEDPNGNGEADEIPFSNGGLQHARTWLLGAFNLHEWGPEVGEDGEVFYTPASDNTREYYKFMNKLFAEDLLDEELFSQSDEMKKAKAQDNRIGLFQDWFSFFTTGETEKEAINNPMFKPLTSEFSPERTIATNPQMTRGTFAISTSNPYPEATMRWVDYLYSPEGHVFFQQGPEGYFWDWEDEEGGDKVLTERAAEEGEEYRGEIDPAYGLRAPGIVLSSEAKIAENAAGEEEVSDFTDFLISETKEKLEPFGTQGFPLIYLTEDEIEVVRNIEGELETYLEEQEAKFITGQIDPSDDAAWEEYLGVIDQMDVDKLLEIYQEAYDRQ